MLTKTFAAISLLAASAYGELAGFSAMDRSFGAMLKRQGGYYPTTHNCGTGDTCAEACGPGQVQCPSTSGLYCYDPSQGDTCCPDGSGNSCSVGYYCTSDGAGNTYCCPNGLSLSDCGAAYSLTVGLISETGSVAAATSTTGAASTTPATASTPTVSASSGLIHVSVSIPSPSSPKVIGTGVPTTSGNATFSKTASAPAQVNTNAAEKMAYGGVGVGVAVGLVGAMVGL